MLAAERWVCLISLYDRTKPVLSSLEETAAAATVALRGEIATTDRNQKAYIERCPYGIVFGMVSSFASLLEGVLTLCPDRPLGSSCQKPVAHVLP